MLAIRNAPLLTIIAEAYGIASYRIAGPSRGNALIREDSGSVAVRWRFGGGSVAVRWQCVTYFGGRAVPRVNHYKSFDLGARHRSESLRSASRFPIVV